MAQRSKEVAKKDPRDITIAGFTLSAVGVQVEGKPSFEDWQLGMQFVERANSGVLWWYGDMLNHGYANYGEIASQYDGDGKFSQKSLYQAKWVASAVPLSIRIESLAFEHHAIVAGFDHDTQKEWLERSASEGWTVSQLRKEVQNLRARRTLEATPLPAGKYSVIYADPPWRYDFAVSQGKDKTDDRRGRQIENHYPTMEVEDICGMPVRDIAAADSVLFLWATSPKLPQSFEVMEAWGFEYKTCLVWRKDKMGMGYYARQQHELLLVGTHGEPPTPPPDKRPPSVVDGVRSEHSRKPDKFYSLIEEMYPNVKKVELFCRKPRAGWAAWGNEVADA